MLSAVGADGDTDGTIDPGDYALWRARFGNTLVSGAGSGAGAGQASATPEPGTVVLLLTGLLTLRLVRRRR